MTDVRISLQNQLESVESLIRQGQIVNAQALIAKLSEQKKVDRKQLPYLAQLATRSGLPKISLRLLSKFVRPSSRERLIATSAEKCEYAWALILLGAVREGLGLLEGLNENEVPRTHLYRAFGLFSRWSYDQAIPGLRRYTELEKDVFLKRNGELNLAAAYIYEGAHREADEILSEVLQYASSAKLLRMQGNVLRLKAMSTLEQGKWSQALKNLDSAAQLGGAQQSEETYFMRKWRIVIDLHRDPKTAGSKMLEFRADAMKRHDWESVRNSDYHLAICLKDKERARFHYFGTPFAHYREKFVRHFENSTKLKINIADAYIKNDSPKLDERQRIDIGEARDLDRKISDAFLTHGELPHRLLILLSRDFYRPQRLFDIYGEVYRDRYYNPVSSPLQMRQLLHRLRGSLKNNKIALQIIQQSGRYWNQAAKGCVLSIAPDLDSALNQNLGPGAVLVERVWALMGDREFATRDVLSLSDASRPTVERYLAEALAQGRLLRRGAGRSTRYAFVAPLKMSKK